MNWMLPGFLASGLLIGIPIALHFLRSERKITVPFPTLRFLGPSAIRDTRRNRLRRRLALLLRCLVIGLIAAAFARPFWKNPAAARHGAMVIAIDNSMSMQAAGRWGERQRWAARQLDELAPGDQAGLLVMAPEPSWIVPLTDQTGRVRAALMNAGPGFWTMRYEPALRMAGDALAGNPAGTRTLVWMADEQAVSWNGLDFQQQLPAGIKIRFAEAAPAPKRQAAIRSVRRLPATGEEMIEVTIRLYEPGQESRRVRVYEGGEMAADKTVSLTRGENRIELALAPEKNGQADGLRISLDPDDLPADDTAWLAIEPSAQKAVVTEPSTGTDFLGHALQAAKQMDAGALGPASLPDGEWPAGGVAIVHSGGPFREPQRARLERFVNGGGALWIFVDGSPEQIRWLADHGIKARERAASNEPWHLRDWDPESPILAAFAGETLMPLLDIEFYKGFDLSGENLDVVANWPDGAVALAACMAGGKRIFIAGFPLLREATNWLVQPSFVPFVHQTVRWLALLGDTRTDWRVGDSIPLPPGDGAWRSLDPPDAEPGVKASGSVRPAAPGLYEFTTGQVRRIFAVNTPPEESDLTPWPKPELLAGLEAKDSTPSRVPRSNLQPVLASDEEAEARQRIWWWLLAFCGVAMLAELMIANRTAI